MSGHAPVALFVYNRPDHTEQTLRALAKNTGAGQTDLYIFSDAAKNEGAASKVAEVRALVSSVAQNLGFASVKVVLAEKNKGLAASITSGVTQVMQEHGRCIVLEDDLVTAPDFLEFVNACLDKYETDPRIGQVTGYSVPLKVPSDYSHSVYLMPRTCSYGWATWRDRWEAVDWKATGFEAFSQDREARRRFDSCGADRFPRLRRQLGKGANSWSILFGFSQFVQGKLAVYPVQSRLRNIGMDGSGVHQGSERLAGKIKEEATGFQLTTPEPDPRLLRQVASFYEGGWKSKVGRLLRDSGLQRVELLLRRWAGR